MGYLARLALLLLSPSLLAAAPLAVKLSPPQPAETSGFSMGTSARPDGQSITADSRSLRFDGQPWTPVMGEFHSTRYPAGEWREELLKMNAGGVDIVATYVFWIHHEEIEGQWDWTGSRDLRRFVTTARDAGLKVIVRSGPWCHGEVRNGGLPDWIVSRGHVRTNDPAYLANVRELYAQIAAQLKGLFWKDGGPVIGIQLENEYGGPAEHLLTLKKIAREAGLDVPLYTRTGWPELKTPMPFGEILPLYGVYAEGFWDRELTAMPGHYWAGFHFSTLRTDANIANEALGRRDAKDPVNTSRYPFLTCEIGGGMMSSYHRRIAIDPRDIEATTLVKLGSGSNSLGYYMYQGGTNPDGKLSTLMENQSTAMTNWNDLPEKNYDFQAPLGQYGQIRPHYHLLRRLHYFLRDCGSDLAGMPVALPDHRPLGKQDLATLRWAARSDGRRGFVFVNNYQRLQPMPPKPGVQFSLTLASGAVLMFPSAPITIPADHAFIWPFNLDLGGVILTYATAQPETHVIDSDGTRTIFFAETPGVPAEFAFDGDETGIDAASGQITREAGRTIIRNVHAGHNAALRLKTKTGRRVQIVLLDDADSLALWKTSWQGRSRLFLTHDTLVADGESLRLSSTASGPQSVAIFPAPEKISLGNETLSSEPDGLFQRYALPADVHVPIVLQAEQTKSAGALRAIPLGKAAQPVAAAPTESDFAAAAVWRIPLPPELDLSTNPILRLHYIGDVARVMIGDRMVTDDFYNGNVLEIGLRRHADLLKHGELRVAILPLQKDAPIYFSSPTAKAGLGDLPAVAALQSAEIVTRSVFELTRD